MLIEKKRIGRPFGTKKPLLEKKQRVQMCIEQKYILKFGNEIKLKLKLIEFIENYGTEKKPEVQASVQQKPVFNIPNTYFEKPKKIVLKRTPQQWVELRRECNSTSEYIKWLEEFENDTFLTANEKKQIKATN